MKNIKKPTVTVAVIAYNEGENIKNLLEALLRQKEDLFKLEKLLVISDGSKDTTVEKVRSIKHPKIELQESEVRKGLAYRLNQAFRMNKSDIFVKIDGDCLPLNDQVMNNLIKEFSDETIGIVSARRIPVPGRTFIEKIHNIGDTIWHETKKDIKNGNNKHNHIGTLHAIKKRMAGKIKIPKGLYGTDSYIYFSSKLLKYKFKFAAQSIVLYKNPDNFDDYFKQHTRFLSSKYNLARIFGDWIYVEYLVPRGNIIKAILRSFLKSPFLTVNYFLVELLIRLKLKFLSYQSNQFGWEPTRSTKRNLNIYKGTII